MTKLKLIRHRWKIFWKYYIPILNKYGERPEDLRELENYLNCLQTFKGERFANNKSKNVEYYFPSPNVFRRKNETGDKVH